MEESVLRMADRAAEQVVGAGQQIIYDIEERCRQWHTAVERLEAAVKRVEEIEAASIRLLAVLLPYMKK